MAGLATAEFANVFKTQYIDPLNQQVYKSHVLLDRLDKSPDDVSGDDYVVPLITGRNQGFGSRKDVAGSGPKIPIAGRQSYSKATYKMALHYGRGQVSGPVMRKSRTDEGAFARALDIEMKGLMESLPEDLNRQLCNTGNGRVFTLAATATTGQTAILASSKHPFNVRVGDRVHADDITAGGDIAHYAGQTVSTIARDTTVSYHTVTLSAAGDRTLTIGDDAFYYGSPTSATDTEESSRGQNMYGILDAVHNAQMGDFTVDGGTAVDGEAAEYLEASLSYGGISRSTNSFWQCQVLNNPVATGRERPLTIGLLEQAWMTSVNIGGALPSEIEIFTNPSIWTTWGLLDYGNKTFSDYKQTLETGWEFLNFNGSKVFYDRDLPRAIIFFLHMPSLMLLTQGGYQLLDDDGTTVRMVAGGGRDAWEFTLNRDLQLGCRNCFKHTRLNDIASAFKIEG